MSKDIQTYTQCVLHRQQDESILVDVCWIPTHLARAGKRLEIKQEDGSWQPGWVVHEKGTTDKKEAVEGRETDYKRQRGESDI